MSIWPGWAWLSRHGAAEAVPDADATSHVEAVEARRRAQLALGEALRQRQESAILAEQLRSQRTANRFAERIAEAFKE